VSATCVVGLQWGDEAKGKIVDWLAEHHDVVVRYNGGANAGHTVVRDGKKYKFSLIPTGVLWPGRHAVIGCGVVVAPSALLAELQTLEQVGIAVRPALRVSDRAHVIFPYHVQEEQLAEQASGNGSGCSIGTTLRGIGPCYADKAARRHAVRLGELFDTNRLRERLREIIAFKGRYIRALWPEAEPLDVEAVCDEYCGYADQMRDLVADTTALLHQYWTEGKRLLFEGAQGSLLDVDHGTYPYVTSSHSISGGISGGTGVPARVVDCCVGVVKAYTTRVGAGPFPTELHDEIGETIRRAGNEFGTVTGRPRRCGWFDAVAARYSARINGVDRLSVMLLDVLSEVDEIKICTAYELDGERLEEFPGLVGTLQRCKPVYQTLAGWGSDITQARRLEDLPPQARRYLDTLAELLEVPIELVSVGPDRRQTLCLR
jgi:adenylosuccinate synthase